MSGSTIIKWIVIVIFLFGGAPLLAQAPTATTQAATGETATTAVVHGTVNANGSSTTVTFEYGLDTGYGGVFTADQSPVTGSTGTAVSVEISELAPNTTYHYRVVATNTNGTTNGADMTFTTAPPAPIVLTGAATAIGTTTATVNGVVNAMGNDAAVTFEYGLDTSYGSTATAAESPVTGVDAAAVSAALTGLSDNTTYHYRVVATNVGGTSYGADMTFTTGAGSAPTVVTATATAVNSTQATLNGTVTANGPDTAVTFEYGLDTGYGSTIPATPGTVTGISPASVSANVTDLLPNTTYHYRVVATNANGTTNGSDMTFTTLPLAPTATTDAASAIGTTGATLNGTVNANDGSTVVTFQYGMDTGYGSTVTATPSPVTGSTDTAVSRAITGLTNGVTYHYRVVATNAGGTTYGSDMTFTTGAAAPTATTDAASAVGDTTATLNGTVNANNASTTVSFELGETTSYGRVLGASPSPVTGSTDTAVSLDVTGLNPGTLYHYRVVAVNANGTTYGADMTFATRGVPTVVTIAATGVSGTGATLNGTVNANTLSTTVTFEYGTTTGYGTTVGATPGTVTGNTVTAVSAALTGLTPGTVYHYRVVGTNADGTSNGADMTFITTVGAPVAVTDAATVVLSDSAVLNGTVTANNADTTVTFEYGPDTGYGTTVTADQSPVDASGINVAVSASITGLTIGNTYHYRVVGTNASGTANGNDMTFTTSDTPAAVTEPATTVGATAATINGIVNANSQDPAYAYLEYGTAPDLTGAISAYVGNISGTADDTAVSLPLTGLTPATTYYFRAYVAYGVGSRADGSILSFTTTGLPTAVTDAATGVGAFSATLNGTVNAAGNTTTVYFQYGEDTSYGYTAPAPQSPVTGSADTPVTASLTTLRAQTTYHFRVVIVTAVDTVYGADQSFTTGSAPPTAVTAAATSLTSTGATLNGLVDANNESTTVTFEYGPDTGYGTSTPAAESPVSGAGNTNVSLALTGLATNTVYHYRVVAQSASGTAYGADMTFNTGAAAPTATTDAATTVGPTGAALNGTVNANGATTTVTFEYGETTNYDRVVAAVPGSVSGTADTAVSVELTGLSANTTYHYRVVGQNAAGTSNGADMTFTTGAAGAPTVTTAAVTNITHQSARSGGEVLDEGGSAVTARGVCWSTVPSPTVADSRTTNGTGLGTFTGNLTGLSGTTIYYVRAYATNAYGSGYGEEFQFTTNSADVNVEITDPGDGEVVSGTVTIAANAWLSAADSSSTASVQAISKVEFYIDDSLISEDNAAPYEIQWDTTTVEDGSHDIKAVAYDQNNNSSQDTITVTVNNSQPALVVTPTSLNFSSLVGDGTTGPQTLTISNTGTGTLLWEIGFNSDWLICNPLSGQDSGMVDVSVDASSLPAGSYSDVITVSSNNGTVTIPVNLTIYDSGSTSPPFGDFSTPIGGSTVSGSIPVTGWSLDDIETISVGIYISYGSGIMSFVGDAVFVEGARPDIAAMYPDMPFNTRAGWGYMMLTNTLPNGGNGTYTIYAKAIDAEGNQVTLGTKTINVDNVNAVKPFGAIDTPTQGGLASGSSFVNFGWALTPLPNTIPTDGSTIIVWVDGYPLGNVDYGHYRKDIADLFPTYNNSDGASGNYFLDTTQYENGVHTIAWSVEDDAGNKDGMGSRYFTIMNNGGSGKTGQRTIYNPNYSGNGSNDEITTSVLRIKELEHVEFQVSNHFSHIRGFMSVNGKNMPLPIGSTLDLNSGRFFWDPGAGFIGTYKLVFVIHLPGGEIQEKTIKIKIDPK